MKRSIGEDGKIYYSIRTSGREYRYSEDDHIYPTDVWTDIEHLHQRDGERTGYPTQKPMALLDRIVRSSCPQGGVVCDLFSGSGTSACAAVKSGRRFIAADSSPFALLSLIERLDSGQNYTKLLFFNTELPMLEICRKGTCVSVHAECKIVFLELGHIYKDAFFPTQRSVTGEIEITNDETVLHVVDENARHTFYAL